ncbi:MAG: hypothetical protein WCS64_05300 [Dehalococcoidales bacterium]
MKKIITILLTLLISVMALSQDKNSIIKLTDGNKYRVKIILLDLDRITYETENDIMRSTKIEEVEFVETENDGFVFYQYDKEEHDIYNETLKSISENEPMELIKQGGKVFIPISAKDYKTVLGRFFIKDKISESNLWQVVDTEYEAEFILEYYFEEKGRDKNYFVLKTRDGAEFYRSKNILTSSSYIPMNEAKKSVEKLYKKVDLFHRIETADNSTFVYQMDEIEKMIKEPIKRKSSGSNSRSGLQSGYKGIIELGYQIGVGEKGKNRLKLNIINGYQINPHLSLGLGTGLRYYLYKDAVLIPIFADLRVSFMSKNVLPYFSLGVGYSFSADNSFAGVGVILEPSIGVSFKVSKKFAINLGGGYEMQRMTLYKYNYNKDTYSERKYISGAISINVGISF